MLKSRPDDTSQPIRGSDQSGCSAVAQLARLSCRPWFLTQRGSSEAQAPYKSYLNPQNTDQRKEVLLKAQSACGTPCPQEIEAKSLAGFQKELDISVDNKNIQSIGRLSHNCLLQICLNLPQKQRVLAAEGHERLH